MGKLSHLKPVTLRTTRWVDDAGIVELHATIAVKDLPKLGFTVNSSTNGSYLSFGGMSFFYRLDPNQRVSIASILDKYRAEIERLAVEDVRKEFRKVLGV